MTWQHFLLTAIQKSFGADCLDRVLSVSAFFQQMGHARSRSIAGGVLVSLP